MLLASVSDYAIFSVGLDERIASWNPGVERILGFDMDEFVGQPFALLFTPEDRAAGIPEQEIRDARVFGRAAARREYRRKNGTRAIVESILTPILDAGEIIGFADVLRDDTQQQRLLEEMTLRAAELDAIFESIPDGLYVGDLSGVRDCNARGLEMLGFEHRGQLNRRVAEVARDIETRFADSDELMNEEQQPFVRALAGEQVIEEVKTRNVRTGKITIVRSAASPIWKDGVVAGAVAINTDITEQRRAEKERARLLADERAARLEAEAREKDYRFLAESIPEIVWTVNREGVSQYYNLRWYAYTGLSASESVLRPWHQVVAPDQFDAFLERWTAALNSGATFEMELRLRNSEGAYCWHLCRALPQRQSDGTVTR
ncbi:MAG TPA: PAS domain S-box protein, partial [Bryobacteraceae bacterium]|nr:PAS domain S-box protein [Bryobacteraceae bacterium]